MTDKFKITYFYKFLKSNYFCIYKMERMKVVDLKVLANERGLRGYSKLEKAELITFLQNLDILELF